MELLMTLADVERWLQSGATPAAAVQGVDLRGIDALFSGVDLAGCVFLGCTMGTALCEQTRQGRVGVVSEFPSLPPSLPAFRQGMYRVRDLYAGMADDGTGWERTPDFRGFDFFNERRNRPRQLTPAAAMAARVHDTVQEQAVRAFLQNRDVVAIMGGHDFKRRLEPADIAAGQKDVYWECVRIARTLTERGFLIVTGGGPGLMEAGNLGALLAGEGDDTIAAVRTLLSNHPFDSSEWRASAMRVRAHLLGAWDAEPPAAKWSVGIPTWLYGHEPPNLFASHHSKMFFNSLREDGLVTLANKGIVFFEGNAGTVQEIFQDATQNYYLGAGQTPTPMVFYNAGGYWSRPCDELVPSPAHPVDFRKPLLPLVRQLAIEKQFVESIVVTDDAAAVIAFLIDARREARTHKADVKLGNVSG
jgi:predicted Rossmann-fold nucleotide-binding protein